MILYRKKANQWVKPPIGAQIDWGHPLTRGLKACFILNENSGDLIFDPINRISLRSTIPFPTTNSKWEHGLILNDAGIGFKVATPQVLRLSYPITVVWKGIVPSAYQTNSQGFYFGCSYSNLTLSPSIAYGIKIGSFGILHPFGTYVAGTNDGSIDRLTSSQDFISNYYNQPQSISPNLNYYYFLAARFGNPNGPSIEVLVGANPVFFIEPFVSYSINPTLLSAPAYALDSTFGFGSITDAGGVNMHSTNIYGLVYNTIVSNNNLEWLNAEPYCYFLPTMSKRYFFPLPILNTSTPTPTPTPPTPGPEDPPDPPDPFPIVLEYNESDFNSGFNG